MRPMQLVLALQVSSFLQTALQCLEEDLARKSTMPTPTGLFFALWLMVAVPAQKPEWCRDLPRPAYRALERVAVPDEWFEVYRIRPGVFAIYEPHQQEEVISYLVLGTKRAVLFDTGMGISDIKKLVEHLTP